MNRIASEFGKTVLVSTHPRTRKRLKALKSSRISQKVKLFKPFGFFDYVKLEQNAICTISDSGTIAEEASIASFPAITMRNSFERPEALDAGSIMLTGLDQETVVRSIRLAMKEREISRLAAIPQEYTIRDTSWRVLKLITGTFHLSNKWHGMYAGERV
jgi:UDP-N-acetylglucosamine 2-epimerase (non-hydrolysing)